MSTTSIQANVTFRCPRRVSLWSEVAQYLTEWRRRSRSRAELLTLDDMSLRDIGISRCTAQSEAAKPFWMA